jgi:hypothetical protein
MLSLTQNEHTRLIATMHRASSVDKTKRGPPLGHIYVDLSPGIFQKKEALLEVDDIGELLEPHAEEIQLKFGIGRVVYEHLVDCVRKGKADLHSQSHNRALKYMEMLVSQSLRSELDFTGPEHRDIVIKPYWTTESPKGEQHYHGVTAFGASGLGKSVALADLIVNNPAWKKIKTVYLYSKVATVDKAWEPVRKKYRDNFVPIDLSAKGMQGPEDDFLESIPLTAEALANDSLIVCDDISSTSDPEIRDAVFRLQTEIIQVGRHRNQHCISSNHRFAEHGKTRHLRGGSPYFVMFARSSDRHLKDDLLRDQYGLPAADRRTLLRKLKAKSRSVFIHNTYPSYIVGGGVVRLLI